ncbi:hypothetical protein ACFONG_18955 [Uliginosibacterium paludis]|uniref:Beta-glucosidase/6-phospho-beta-glucosidase/beta-galactosidase n=1 Tax=Uliginosibacterium paludis TaxID=1615952 RepID=A0ABV2CT45_9RHOO
MNPAGLHEPALRERDTAVSSLPPDTAPAPAGSRLFRSFWMGGFEGADHVNSHGVALDMHESCGHAGRIGEDFRLAAVHGLTTLRESIGWRRAEPRPGRYDFRRALAMAQNARINGVQIIWSLMHYGTPPDVSLLDDSLIPRFAWFAAAAASALAPLHDDSHPPIYNPINEIGFLAWAVTSTRLIHPHGPPEGVHVGTVESGYNVKRRLVKATLAAMEAIREVDPRARFLQIEPMVHVVPPADRPELASLAQQISDYQWQVWDMLAGRMAPELGGSPEALDLIGINHYHDGQWEALTEKRLHWHERDPRRRPLSGFLADNWQRYGRPLILAETGHFGAGRAAWLDEVASEVHRAHGHGVPVEGICLYPLTDRHDWNTPSHWHHSGLWDASPHDLATPATVLPRTRLLHNELAATLNLWRERLPGLDLKGMS